VYLFLAKNALVVLLKVPHFNGGVRKAACNNASVSSNVNAVDTSGKAGKEIG